MQTGGPVLLQMPGSSCTDRKVRFFSDGKGFGKVLGSLKDLGGSKEIPRSSGLGAEVPPGYPCSKAVDGVKQVDYWADQSRIKLPSINVSTPCLKHIGQCKLCTCPKTIANT